MRFERRKTKLREVEILKTSTQNAKLSTSTTISSLGVLLGNIRLGLALCFDNSPVEQNVIQIIIGCNGPQARNPFNLASTVYCLSIRSLSMLYGLSCYHINLFLPLPCVMLLFYRSRILSSLTLFRCCLYFLISQAVIIRDHISIKMHGMITQKNVVQRELTFQLLLLDSTMPWKIIVHFSSRFHNSVSDIREQHFVRVVLVSHYWNLDNAHE